MFTNAIENNQCHLLMNNWTSKVLKHVLRTMEGLKGLKFYPSSRNHGSEHVSLQ